MVTVKTGERLLLSGKIYDIVEDVEEGQEKSEVSLPLPKNADGVRTIDSPENIKNVLVGVHGHGYIGLIDFMGEDSSIVQAARTSYGKGTKKTREDRGLIRYLMRHSHTTPFEMVEFKFLVKMPIFIARQWVRHRTANINEYSGRYSVMTDEFYVPEVDNILGQSTRNRQGSEGVLPEDVRKAFVDDVTKTSQETYSRYQKALAGGISREMSRILLPLNLYTKWYWKNDLHNILHFLLLRMDAHAQQEIRDFAIPMYGLVSQVAPITCEAFMDFSMQGVRLSDKEQNALSLILNNGEKFEKACELSGIELIRPDGKPMTTGEGPEFRDKLEKIRGRAQKILSATEVGRNPDY